MKPSRYTESYIFQMLKEAGTGVPVPQLCRKHGMSSASFYKWRANYGGVDVSHMTRLKELEEENRHLKKMYAESKTDAEILREALAKKYWCHHDVKRWRSRQWLSGAYRCAGYVGCSRYPRPAAATGARCRTITR